MRVGGNCVRCLKENSEGKKPNLLSYKGLCDETSHSILLIYRHFVGLFCHHLQTPKMVATVSFETFNFCRTIRQTVPFTATVFRTSNLTTISLIYLFSPVVLRPIAGQGFLILEVSISHIMTHHSR